MQAHVWTVQHTSLFWRVAGHLQNISLSGFILSIVLYVSSFYIHVSVYICGHLEILYYGIAFGPVKSIVVPLQVCCHVTLFHSDWSYGSLFYEINNGIDTSVLHCQSPSHPKKWLTGNNDSSIMALFSICSCQGFTVIRRRLPVRLKSESWVREWDSHALSRL